MMHEIGQNRWRTRFATLVMLCAGATAASAQQQGTITGRITDAQGGRPIPSAQVQVVGTSLGQLTNDDGRYTIRGVTPGDVRVRVLRVGYGEQVRAVTVAATEPTTLDIALTQVSIQLSPVVTTATGEQRRSEVGNNIAQVDAAKVTETSPVTNINDLLTARAAGVQVLQSGAVGTGARVRIRGTNSLSLSNDPIYVVDGIRIEASSTGQRAQSIGLGGSSASRLNDLNPEEIENIEIVKGPSAATLYGTDAANGVIVITTKKGRAGRAQWSTYVEQGMVTDLHDFPTNYSAFGKTAAGANATTCFVPDVAAGRCLRDSVTSFTPLNNDETSFLKNGWRQQYGAQLSGGSEAIRYFVSGEYEGQDGIQKLPDFERARFNTLKKSITDFVDDPNRVDRESGRANLNMSPTQKLDLAVNVGYTQLAQRLPNLDNNTFSPFAQALFGPGQRTKTPTLTGGQLNGYAQFIPGDIYEESYTQDVNRMIASTTGNWRPLSWFSGRGNFGLDFSSIRETDVCKFQNCPPSGTTRLGFAQVDRRQITQYTADVGGTASFQLLPSLGSKTSVGVQYFNNVLSRDRAVGTQLPPGATTPAAGSVPSVASATDEARTFGTFVEEAVAWRERLFATVGARYDNNSAFGDQFGGVVYPKASLSWVLSDEPFFPAPSWLSSFRIRSAVGQSGVRPGTNDALEFYSVTVARLAGADNPGLTFTAPGNKDLKPETTTEIEGGFDASLFSSRVGFELTYYSKRSKDALIQRIIPPSAGTGNANRFENLGSVTNKGVEALISAQLFRRDAFGWDVSLNGSSVANKLVDLGGVPAQVGATTRQTAGYPLNGYWQRKYTYADANNDKLITANEITVADSSTFIGYSTPRTEITLSNGIDLFHRRVRLQALVDYKGGHYLYNNTYRFKCVDAANCRGRNDPTAPLFEQARSVAATELQSLAGFIEKADYIRFRELSLTYSAPDAWASRLLRARALSATLSARNLGFSSDYTGIDPESTYGQTDLPADFLTFPPPSVVTFRLNVRF